MEANEFRVGNYIQATHEYEIDRGNGIIEDIEEILTLKIRGIDLDSQLIDGSCTFSLEEKDGVETEREGCYQEKAYQ